MDGHVPAARRATPDDRAVLVDIFVAAFEDDPWYRWRYPGADYRGRAAEWFDLVTGFVWERADAWLTEGGDAAVIWVRPGRAIAEPSDLADMWSLVERQHGDRAPEVAAALAAALGTEPPRPHALCLFAGVRPGRQGLGLGQQVMAPALDVCDRERLPAFLNSTNPRNVSFYERLGFRSTSLVEVAPNITFRSMLREPRS